MKNTMLFGLLLIGVFSLASCEKNTFDKGIKMQLVDKATMEHEANTRFKSAPPCDCRLISRGSSYNINVCGQGVSSVPCTMSPCPGSGTTRNLYSSNQDFLVSSGATFQLKNTGVTTFAGSVRCQSGSTTNLSYPVILAPGQVAYFDTNASTCQVGSVDCF
ncbi:MAG: hypothetical protein HRU41_07910 [Saprospiraceae bacterium]|nr:hypothetical protein [Saprospiraceae bacterium]